MPNSTTNLGLYKPLVNDATDQDLWGGYLNTNMDTLDLLMPPGLVFPYAGSTAPSGFLLCYGQAVSRTTYANLFSAISTTYGTGDGSTTFNLPDMRGRSAFGKDDMGGSAASRVTNAVSGITGTTLGSAGGDQRQQSHTHTVTDPGHTHSTVNGANVRTSAPASGADAYQRGTDASAPASTIASATTGISLATTGAGSSQNMPPAIILSYIIKT